MTRDNSKSMTSESGWTTRIRPHSSLLDFRLGELWRYRDLIQLFVWRDFVSVYKQTILGPAWHIIQPLLTTLTFTIIFGKIAGLSTDGLPPFVFYMAGTIIWTYFSNCFTKTAGTFVTNASLFGKVYFHRLAIPISVVISNLVAFAIQLGIFLGFLIYFALKGTAVHPNWHILLTPVLVLMMGGFGLGAGIIVSALTTRYRDLTQLVTFGVQLLMYATPVIYPVSEIPENYRWLVMLNPLSPVVEIFRRAFLGAGTLTLTHLAISFGVMVVVLFAGLLLFNRVERTFMDTV